MIAKISKGAGFRGALNYVLLKEEAELIGGNMAGHSPRALAHEFSAAQSIRGRCTKPVAHYSLSSPPGEHLSNEQWNHAALVFLQAMGYSEKNPYVVAHHKDRDHDHIHIIVSRVGVDRKVVPDGLDFKRSHTAARAVEQALGLPSLDQSPQQTNENSAQNETSQGLHADLRHKIDAAAERAQGDRERFAQYLEVHGVQVKFNLQSTGRILGISFIPQDNRPVKGSELGKGYGWAAIENRIGGQHQTQPQSKQTQADATVIGEISCQVAIAPPAISRPAKIALNSSRTRMIVGIDQGECIQAFTQHPAAISATIKRAADKGWAGLHLSGSKAFRREAWLQAQLHGIATTGYTPSFGDGMKLRALSYLNRSKEQHHERQDYPKHPARLRRGQRAAIYQPGFTQPRHAASARTLAGLRHLSSVAMVYEREPGGDSQMLLRAHAFARLGTRNAFHHDVRWPGAVATRNGSQQQISAAQLPREIKPRREYEAQ